MAIELGELFQLARQVEVRLAELYEEMVAHLQPGSEEAKFFAKLAAQEHIHASWVDEMIAEADPSFIVESLSPDEFHQVLDTVDDVHDEVVNKQIALPDALEIVIHLENSTSEGFYMHFPENVPGVPDSLIARMMRSCMDHVQMVVEFRNKCIKRGAGGVHQPPSA